MIRNVIFDLDDTLFMTEEASFDIENEVAILLGHPPMSRAAHRVNWGMPIEEAIIERIPNVQVARFLDLLPKVISEFAASDRLDVLSQANMRALDSLVSKGYKLSIVTSRTLSETKHLLSPDHKLIPFIPPQSIFHKDNNTFVKPDPRAFDAAMEGDAPENGVYIGDSVTDCLAAKEAGLHFVACMESGLRSKSDFTGLAMPPDGYIDTLAALPAWLDIYNL